MSTATVVPASRWFRHWWPLLLLAAAVFLLVAFVGLSWWIQGEALETGTRAMRVFPGDRVEALIAYVDSDSHTLRERNRAVWALGQLRDARALPVLLKHRTGRPCDHARLICQREVENAITQCQRDPARNWISRLLTVPVRMRP